MSRSPFVVVLVVAQLAVGSASVGVAAAGAPVTAGLSVRATVPSTLPHVRYSGWWTGDSLVGSPSGVAYGRGVDGQPGYAVSVRPTGSAAAEAVGMAKSVSMVGDQLVGWTSASSAQLVAVSMSTGVQQPLGPTGFIDADSELTSALPRGTGNGWLEAPTGALGTSDALVLHVTATGTTASFPFPDADTRTVVTAAADGAGAVLTVAYGSTGVPVGGTTGYAGEASYYVDFTTGTWTALAGEATAVALSPRDVAWLSGSTLSRVSRSAPGATPELRTVPSTTTRIAITDGATAWSGVDGSDVYQRAEWAEGGTVSTALEPASTLGVRLEGHVVNAAELAALGGNDFAVALDGGTLAGGIYSLTAGSTMPGPEIDAFPRSGASSSEGPGLHATIAADGSYATVQQVTITGGALSLTKAHRINAPAGGAINAVALGSGRTAVMTTVGTRSTVTVSGAGAATLRFSVPASTHDLQLVGRWLELSDWQRKNGAFRAHARLLDLSRPGLHWLSVPGPSALSGHRLAYLKPDGSVWLRDLAVPHQRDVRVTGAGTPPGAHGGDMAVSFSGDWVTWSEYDYTHPSPFRGSYQVSTKRHFSLDVSATQADGLAAYTDSTDEHAVHLLDLATGQDLEVPGTANAGHLSLSRDVLSYVDLDGDTVLVSLSGLGHVHPRALPITGDLAARTASVSPRNPILATYGTTRPLTSWRFEVRSSKGALVFRSQSSARTGWLRIAWNGLSAQGKPLPAGTYRWTLTGMGAGGSLTNADGKDRPTGLLHV